MPHRPGRDTAAVLPRRRLLLSRALALGATPLTRLAAATDPVPTLPAAFTAHGLAEAWAALGWPAEPPQDPRLVLDMLDLVEDGALAEVSLRCDEPSTRRLLLVVDRNPGALVADFHRLDPAVAPDLRWRVKLAESTAVEAVAVLASGARLAARRRVEVTLGGCGDTLPPMAAPDASRPPGPTRLRARRLGGDDTPPAADVRLQVQHEMSSGQQRDLAGGRIPAWHIVRLTVGWRDRPVLEAWWGPSVSRHPTLQLRLDGARPGDRVDVQWVDNRGFRGQADTRVE